MNCHLQSIHQPQLYEHMLETMTQDDTGSLLLVTSSEKISLSSKLLQTISPLYRDIIRDVGSDIRAQQVTIIIPDTKAVTVQNLLALVTTGQIASDKGDQLSCCDIVNLASSLNIPLKEKDLSRSATVDKPQGKLRVRNMEEILSPRIARIYREGSLSQWSSCNENQDSITAENEIEETDVVILEQGSYESSHKENFPFRNSANFGINEYRFMKRKCEAGKKIVKKDDDNENITLRNIPSFACDECKAVCDNLIELDAHKKKHHTPGVSYEPNLNRILKNCFVHTCTLCGYRFKSMEKLFHHFQTGHQVQEPNYKCATCGLLCMRRNLLKIHVNWKHNRSLNSVRQFEFTDLKATVTM